MFICRFCLIIFVFMRSALKKKVLLQGQPEFSARLVSEKRTQFVSIL